MPWRKGQDKQWEEASRLQCSALGTIGVETDKVEEIYGIRKRSYFEPNQKFREITKIVLLPGREREVGDGQTNQTIAGEGKELRGWVQKKIEGD